MAVTGFGPSPLLVLAIPEMPLIELADAVRME